MIGLLVQAFSYLPPLGYILLALATLLYFKTRRIRAPDNIPPFPVKPYPIVGHILMLTSGMVKKLDEWKKVGNIFSLYVGSDLFVVINSLDILKEAFVKKADYFSDRPEFLSSPEEMKNGPKGIVSSHGQEWKEQRTVSLSILREFGMGKNWLAEKISEEVEVYLEELVKAKGEPQDVKMLTNTSVANVICAILVGERFEFDDPYFTRLLYLLNQQVALLKGFSLVYSFPWLKYLPGDLFNEKKIDCNRREILKHFCMKFIKEKGIEEVNDNPDCFINAYYHEMKRRQEAGHPTTLDNENLVRVVGNLFFAGSDTTSNTIMWAMIYTLNNPQCQDKIDREIEEVIGTERIPNIQDKPKMPYMAAFIMEVQRMGSIAPLGLPHLCNETVDVAGYTIPKGTTILPNLDNILKDPKAFEDPFEFKPERFLDKDNKIVVPEEFIPFSIGRRVCLGESLAKMELFLFLTGIFQRFHLKPEDQNTLPSLEPNLGQGRIPQRFKIRLIEKMER